MTPSEMQRAEPPRAPQQTAVLSAALAERETVQRREFLRERQSILRGLVWLALLILVLSLAHAGLGRTFVPQWWREW